VPANQNVVATLHIRLSRTTKALKAWSKNLMSWAKIAMAICREVITQLDKAQESRTLNEEERILYKTLKQRLLGLATIEKSRARQQSRVTWMKKGDANTKFFHIMANTRRKTLSTPWRLPMK
jgi:RNA polymerase-interacting CarD/CdnL/TRCF family regulator